MTIRELIKRYCEERGLDYDIVKVPILESYKHMRDKKEEMTELHIDMAGIGTWDMKVWKLEKTREWADKRFQKWMTSTNRDMLLKIEGAIELRKNEKRQQNQHWDNRRLWEHEQELLEQQQKETIITNEQTTATEGSHAKGMGE